MSQIFEGVSPTVVTCQVLTIAIDKSEGLQNVFIQFIIKVFANSSSESLQ